MYNRCLDLSAIESGIATMVIDSAMQTNYSYEVSAVAKGFPSAIVDLPLFIIGTPNIKKEDNQWILDYTFQYVIRIAFDEDAHIKMKENLVGLAYFLVSELPDGVAFAENITVSPHLYPTDMDMVVIAEVGLRYITNSQGLNIHNDF